MQKYKTFDQLFEALYIGPFFKSEITAIDDYSQNRGVIYTVYKGESSIYSD